jgi:hypothetical protein
VIGALARWGFDWTWSAPRAGEAVDVGAVLRLVPGMLEAPPDLSGSVACVVERPDGETRRSTLTASGGRVAITERDGAGEPDATVSGTETEWVRALGPDGDLSALEISGDSRLAEQLLRGLIAAATRRAAVA